MSGFEIGFDKPWYLLLLGILPLLWLFSYRSLAGLGNVRRGFAIALRSIVLLLLVLALAEIQLLRTSEKVTVIYLLDQSESIPIDKREAMRDYVIREVREHRDKTRADRAGVIVFGRNASIEIPPFDDDIIALSGLETYLDLRTDGTNLSAALKLAQASFTEDSSKRIVIVTDGNENLGDARAVAATLVESGVGIDVAPVRLTTRAEVAVERIKLPADIRRGQPIDTHIILNNYAERSIAGRLRISRRIGPQEEFLGEESVDLRPGKTVLTFPQQIDQPAVYTYQADFTPDDPVDDLMTQNNRATAFTHVRGKGRVLFIEDWQSVGAFDDLVGTLRDNNLEINRMSSDQLYTSLSELQGYDTVVLANVPRSSGDDAQSVTSFSDDQVEMLVRNTEQMGCGIVMIGGPNSYGAGGWSNTELEKAMPVDFQIKNAKIRAVGAIVLMMHASELADGNFWQKEVAKKAITALGPMDYCGLVHWDFGGDKWLWNHPNGLIPVGSKRNMMLARLGRMTPGDMPEFEPAMKMTLAQFNKTNASVKLMICISDGDPSPPTFGTIARYKAAGIQVSTVAVGAHGAAGHQTLQNISNVTGGRYYVVKDPRALPKIYVSEVRRVARPLIFEPDTPVQPQKVYQHEIMQGIEGPLPPISGFVLTTVKENPLVEVGIRSPLPADEQNSTLLGAWTYGLGRTAVLTTDAGQRWATAWKDWENYDKFFTQLIRWSMRPVDDSGKFSVATDVKDGKVRVVVTALDKDDDFLNFLNMSAAAIDPELGSFDVKIQQVAPGRYVGEFDADRDGNYFLTVSPGPGQAPLMTGVNVPYSSEFRDHETNMSLLTALARLQPEGGSAGEVIEGELASDRIESMLSTNTFREGLAPAVSSQDVWPLFLVVAACVFFADVFIRRVTIGFEWVVAGFNWLRNRLLGGDIDEADGERLERLRSRKQAIAGEIDERRAAARFEPETEDQTADVNATVTPDTAAHVAADPPRPTASQITPDAPAEDSYISRLLKAKKQAWKDPET
jgi:uncharacterized membrane protein